MKLVQVTSGRHPFEVTIMVAAPAVGVMLLVSDARPLAVSSVMPAMVRVVWVTLLVLAGLIGLVGIFWSGRIEVRLSIEAIGVLLLGVATSMYAVAVLAIAGITGAAAGGFTSAVAAAALWRLTQIWRDLRTLDRALRAGTAVEVPLLVDQRKSHE